MDGEMTFPGFEEPTTEPARKSLAEQRKEQADKTARGYWEWHQLNNDGKAPPIRFPGIRKMIRDLIEAGYRPSVIFEALTTLAPRVIPTKQRLIQMCKRVEKGNAPKVVYHDNVLDLFDDAVRRHYSSMPDGWSRNDRVGMVNIVQTLADRGLTETAIFFRLCLFAKQMPTEPMMASLVFFNADPADDRVAESLDWATIEKRVFDWGGIKL